MKWVDAGSEKVTKYYIKELYKLQRIKMFYQ
jgi:hypothetical protein